MAEFSSLEIAWWKAYDRMFPLDHAGRADANTGRIIAAMFAAKGISAKPSDFYRDYFEEWREKLATSRPDAQAVQLSPEALEAKIDAIFSSMMGAA